MSTNKTLPDYEEFKAAVEKELIPLIKTLRETYGGPTAREYIESEEGSRVVKERYEINCKRAISRDIFLGDAAYSAALCLSLMYDGEQ